MNLLNYIEEENFDKNNENLKYLNDNSGNLLQIFEGKNITSNLETTIKFFMSETVCHFICFFFLFFFFFFFFFLFFFCYAGRNEEITANIQTYISLEC